MTTTRRTVLDALATLLVAVVLALPVPGPWTTLLAALGALGLGTSPRGARLLGLAVVLGASGTAVVSTVGVAPWAEGAREMVFALATVGLPWLTGLAWRLRSQVRVQAAEHARQERLQHLDRERRARDAERLALAGALHDDLGHALSLVALNLGKLELDGSLPAAAHTTVEAAREQLTVAVERLGHSVRMLRSGHAPGLAPQDHSLAAVVEAFRAAGATVALEGDPGAGADTSCVVRVVREALTNATKHAPGSPVTVAVEPLRGGSARVVVTNPVPAARPPSAAGAASGLDSLERALTAHDGSLATRSQDGTFRLEAVVPPYRHRDTAPAPDRAVVAVGRRTLLIGAGLGLCAVVVLGGLEIFAQAETRQALLPAEDFARLVEGMPRDDARALLPAHELLPAPASPPGTDCHDYAVATDWLADEAGDAYRVCFTVDRVTSTELLTGAER
ncbi:sensor histidine kinase [Isoptericola variabilis]|uniref:sensor histidine kinase n=1 Tax=Isoptericola variabilis TaxID=139208 RepID=UPI003D252599